MGFVPEDVRRKEAQERTTAPGGGYKLAGKKPAEGPGRPRTKMMKASGASLEAAAEKAGREAAARASGRQMGERLSEERALEGKMRGFRARTAAAKAKAAAPTKAGK